MELQASPLLLYMVNIVLHWNLGKLPFISLPKQDFWLIIAGPVESDQYLLHLPNHQANRFIPELNLFTRLRCITSQEIITVIFM